MRESEIFGYIQKKYSGRKEVWSIVGILIKFDKHGDVKSIHNFDIDCYVSSFGRLMRCGVICDLSYGDKWDISSMFTDMSGRQVRFKRHQIVMQTFFPGERRPFDTVGHINTMSGTTTAYITSDGQINPRNVAIGTISRERAGW